MSQYFSDEVVSQAMLTGLKEALKQELREHVLKELDKEIEAAVASVVNRMNISATKIHSPLDMNNKIRLDVLFMHTNETKIIQENTMTIVKEK